MKLWAWLVLFLGAVFPSLLWAEMPGPELVKDADLSGPGAGEWQPYGLANLVKLEQDGGRILRVRTERGGQPGRRCGVSTLLGPLKAGDLLELKLTYRVIGGGSLTFMFGASMEWGLHALGAAEWETVVARLPVRGGGQCRFWLVQSLSERQGEFLVRRLSARVVERGEPSRFPVVTDGDMEQKHPYFYGPYHAVHLSKDTRTFRSGKRSLRVTSYEPEHPTSMYAGVAAGLGHWPAKTTLHVAFDIKVAKGKIAAIMARGGFDRTFQEVGPGDWQQVEFDYETPKADWYTLYWTRRADVPIDFWLDNVRVTVPQ